MTVYALTIFISAFLLFQVQPMIAKIILPWFGGGAAVWSTCLMFFQIVLLLGYLYSHATTKWLSPRHQSLLHTLILLASLALLPVYPAASWKPMDEKDPLWRILLLLGGTVGLPYLMCSTTGPLLQAWYVRAHRGAIPYRLFALSNFGSFLALLSFPFLVEPNWTSREQANIWSGVYVVFAGLAIFAGWKTVRAIPAEEAVSRRQEEESDAPAPGVAQLILWIGLAACASVMLIAVTSYLTQNVAPIPFLWVLPLSIYLLTFILSFESDRFYRRGIFFPLLIIALGTAGHFLMEENHDGFLPIYLWGAVLFICCMVCHGELALQKPHPKHLTLFFLMVSVGGAVGGSFVGLVAPLAFNYYFELPLSLGLCAVLAVIVFWRNRPEWLPGLQPLWAGWLLGALGLLAGAHLVTAAHRETHWQLLLWVGIFYVLSTGLARLLMKKDVMSVGRFSVFFFALLGLTALSGWLLFQGQEHLLAQKVKLLFFANLASIWATIVLWQSTEEGQNGVKSVWIGALLAVSTLAFIGHLAYYENKHVTGYRLVTRNFYGVLKVRDDEQSEETTAQRTLVHGTINHGVQLLDPARRREVTSYYTPNSGFGRAMQILQRRTPLRVGITGLGAGVTAGFCREGDYFRFYELNPLVLDLAKTQFTFLGDCPGDKDVYLGDGRLILERQASQQFDLLAMDAFSSDSVPVHLLTREVFDTYLKHLKPSGVLAVNVSNRYLDLVPVVTRNAKDSGMAVILVQDDGSGKDFFAATSWMLCNRDVKFFDDPLFQGEGVERPEPKSGFRPWTDSYSNLFQILK
jgi:hypothetical protein